MSTRMIEQFGIRYPLCSAGMAMIATPPLVAAVSAAGAMGILGTGPAPLPWIESAIDDIRARTDKPFGVNLIHEQTSLGPLCTDAHIDLCLRKSVDLVVFFWEPPARSWVQALREARIPVWATVGDEPTLATAVDLGVDGLMLQGREAGGHVRSAVALDDLVETARRLYPQMLLVAAGGIGNAERVRRMLGLGADGVCLGTRFVATPEADAHAEYQRRIVAASASDTTVTEVFGPEWPGVPMRVLRNRATEGSQPAGPIGRTTLFGAPYEMPANSAVLPTRATEGDLDAMCLAAGESAGAIDSVKTAQEIVHELFAGWWPDK